MFLVLYFDIFFVVYQYNKLPQEWFAGITAFPQISQKNL